MAVRSEWLSAKKHNFLTDLDIPAPRNTFLAQLGSIDVRSSEFAETLAKILSSQEDVNTAISLEGDDALTFVDILDQVSGRRTTAASCLTPRTGFGIPGHGPWPPDKTLSHPSESLWFTGHPPTFFYTLEQHSEGG